MITVKGSAKVLMRRLQPLADYHLLPLKIHFRIHLQNLFFSSLALCFAPHFCDVHK